MPPVILLDALGTLLELAPPAPRLRAALAARLGAEVSEADAAAAIAAEIAFYRAHLDEGRDARSLTSLHDACAEVVRDALGDHPAVRDASRELVREALLSALHFDPYPDALPFLQAAREAGRRVVVVSNWDVSLHEVLARTGLAPWLDAVLTSAEAGSRKPAPGIFRAALQRAGGVEPGDAVHVGDSIVEDIEGARAAGLAAVLVVRDGREAPPGIPAVRKLTELCDGELWGGARLAAPRDA